METKCDPHRAAKSLKKLGFDDYVINSNNGFAGVGNVRGTIHSFDVSCHNGHKWLFTAIYASPNDVKRRNMWDLLKTIASNINLPWLLAEDFNDIAYASEKKGGAQASSRKCKLFRDKIEDCSLMDLGACGPAYTWRGPIFHGGQIIYERLDRALSNESWRLDFHEATVKVLPRVEFSDHHPLMISLTSNKNARAPSRFRFESAWMVEEKYKERLLGIWKKNEGLKMNLKLVEDDAKYWKCKTLNHMQKTKKEIMARLNGVQKRLYGQSNQRALQRLENKLQYDLARILKQEELMWFQRSRSKWLADGDKNIKYYHLKTITRRRRNKTVMLKTSNGDWT
ncbi:uncharacterized protein LOC131654707 [Vicia villosa]|uniref:uncharacterized protein LOC131654707 n=1 Tax=Vicia villosa TaxID=3911 RepID=UPI00273A768E|nr:uncharacterized protein LOC131654707 [Vicia villosa]